MDAIFDLYCYSSRFGPLRGLGYIDVTTPVTVSGVAYLPVVTMDQERVGAGVGGGITQNLQASRPSDQKFHVRLRPSER